jgi:lysozyme
MGQILSNERAFLELIAYAEGTSRAPDPYRVCFGYKHTIFDLRDHPAVTLEWRGEKLSDAMCINAGFRPGCKSTAAGKYQLIRPTWQSCKSFLNLPDFSPPSQDRAALLLISQAGALKDIHSGNIKTAISKTRHLWASLPGAGFGQKEHNFATLEAAFLKAGGTLATT